MNPDYTTFEEQIFFSTLRIERPSTETMGTGFLVEVPACVDGRKYIFLITNKHVLDDPSKETRLSFHLKDAEGTPLLGDVFKINVTAFQKGYYSPDSDDVDLALINVSEFVDLIKNKTGKDVNFRNIPIDMISDYKEQDLVPNQKILFIGYPSDRYDHKNYLPILRGGIIASIPKVDFEGKPQVLVDAQVFQGSSGSPVFATLGGAWKFIGVIFQAMVRNQEVQIIETAQQVVTQEMLGIGMIIKSTEVSKLINKAKDDLDSINCQKNSEKANFEEGKE